MSPFPLSLLSSISTICCTECRKCTFPRLQNVAIYPSEKDVFYREHDDLAYSPESFFLQYLSLELPFEVITSLLFAVLTDIAAGMPRTAQMYFVAATNCLCIVSCGESLGIINHTLFTHPGFAVNVTSVFLSVANFMAGTMSINMPAFLRAVNHLSPVKYAIANLAPYSLRGQRFTCTEYQRLPDGHCPIETGEQVLELYRLNGDPGKNLAAVAVCAVVYRLLAYVILKAVRGNWGARWWQRRRDSS
jgi:hypothetical protein